MQLSSIRITIWITRLLKFFTILLVLILPFQTRYIFGEAMNSFTTISLYGFDIIFAITLLLWIIWWRFKASTKVSWLHIFIGLAACTLVLTSGYWSINREVTVYFVGRFAQAMMLAGMIATGPFQFTTVLWALVSNGIIQAIVIFWQTLTQSVIGNKWLGMADQVAAVSGTPIVATDIGRFIRAFGTLPHPNIVGGMLVVSLVSGALLWRITASSKLTIQWQRAVLLVAVTVTSFSLILTFSRTSLLVWFLMLLVLLALRYQAGAFIAVSVASLMVGSIIYRPQLETRLAANNYENNYAEQYSITERNSQIEQAIDTITQEPIYGVGIGAYTLVEVKEGGPERTIRSDEPVHNVYLLTLAEIGILAFIGFWGFIIWPLTKIKFKYPESVGITLLGLTPLLLGILDHYWWTLPSMLLLWFIIIGLQWKVAQS